MHPTKQYSDRLQMIGRIIVALKKLDCRSASSSNENFIDNEKLCAVPSAVSSSSTSFSAHTGKDDNAWRVRDTKSMASFMDGVDKAYGRLHDGYESTVPPPLKCVETSSYSEEMEPLSLISMDPTLYEEGSRWPVYTNQDNDACALQRFSVGATKDNGVAREQTQKDPSGLRLVRNTVDETRPIAHVTELATEQRAGGFRVDDDGIEIQEMVQFSDADSMNYSRFPNSFISITETSMGTLKNRDPSCSSLSEVGALTYFEV